MSDNPGLPKTIPYYLAERIKEGIIRWRYKPGSNLREADLGLAFGSSRGPVREALRLLELQGLVAHSPRRGFRVARHSFKDLEHLYRLRAQLEGTVISALAATDLAELADSLDQINAHMRRCAAAADIDGYFGANIKFHQLIIDRTQSDILIRVLSLINDISLPIRFRLLSQDFPDGGDHDYHQQIADAIRMGHLDAAKNLTEAHIMGNLGRVEALFAQLELHDGADANAPAGPAGDLVDESASHAPGRNSRSAAGH